jgi:DksA/TraR C4-type zinc finger protein
VVRHGDRYRAPHIGAGVMAKLEDALFAAARRSTVDKTRTCEHIALSDAYCLLRMPGPVLGSPVPGSLIGMDAFEALEHDLRAQRARLAQEMLAAPSGLGSFAGTGHGKVEKLAQIDAALMRLVDGRYGACFACGGSIAMERLRLLPATLFCLRCARRRGRGSRVDAARRDCRSP